MYLGGGEGVEMEGIRYLIEFTTVIYLSCYHASGIFIRFHAGEYIIRHGDALKFKGNIIKYHYARSLNTRVPIRRVKIDNSDFSVAISIGRTVLDTVMHNCLLAII